MSEGSNGPASIFAIPLFAPSAPTSTDPVHSPESLSKRPPLSVVLIFIAEKFYAKTNSPPKRARSRKSANGAAAPEQHDALQTTAAPPALMPRTSAEYAADITHATSAETAALALDEARSMLDDEHALEHLAEVYRSRWTDQA